MSIDSIDSKYIGRYTGYLHQQPHYSTKAIKSLRPIFTSQSPTVQNLAKCHLHKNFLVRQGRYYSINFLPRFMELQVALTMQLFHLAFLP